MEENYESPLVFLLFAMLLPLVIVFTSGCEQKPQVDPIYLLPNGHYKRASTGQEIYIDPSNPNRMREVGSNLPVADKKNGVWWTIDHPKKKLVIQNTQTSTKGWFIVMDSAIINLFVDDANDASDQLGTFSSFVSTDGDMSYDEAVADILEGVFDFAGVSSWEDFVAQCELGAGALDLLTPPAACSDFHDDAVYLLSDPLFVVAPEYEWLNNDFSYTLNGNTLEMSATLSNEEMFDITLIKDGQGEVSVSGTAGGTPIGSEIEAHPILIYELFIDEAYEWGFEKNDDTQ